MKVLISLLLALYALNAGAHAKVIESIPPADAVVSTPLKEIVLTFKSPVRLTALTLERKGQDKQPLGPRPAEASARIVVPAPKLTPGEYLITWNAVGQDGHIGTGTIAFSVSSNQTPP